MFSVCHRCLTTRTPIRIRTPRQFQRQRCVYRQSQPIVHVRLDQEVHRTLMEKNGIQTLSGMTIVRIK